MDLYKDALPFAAMVIMECLLVGGNTLYKSASAQGLIDSYVFAFYVFLVSSFIILPCPFIFHRRSTSIPLPPMGFSIVVKISLLSGLMMEKIDFRSYTSQAKILGTMVSISGALIATLYNGPSILLDSLSMKWIIGGILLAAQYLLLSFTLVFQAKIMVMYPVEIMVVFVIALSGFFIAGIGGLIMARDLEAWKVKSIVVLATIIYKGSTSGLLYILVQTWVVRIKGPVYVVMFKPLTILIAVVMGILFLGDSLHLGSVVGGIPLLQSHDALEHEPTVS